MRPIFISNFVQTLDGKVEVTTSASRQYWPIGSSVDIQRLQQRRTEAEVLIHGKQTALSHRTVDQLAQYIQSRERPYLYIVVSGHPDEALIPYFTSAIDYIVPILVTTEEATIPASLEQTQILRLGHDSVDLEALAEYLGDQGYGSVLVEGGPTLMGSFLNANLIDEMYVTIAPKIFGNQPDQTLTMVEGVLFPPTDIKHCQLVSAEPVGNELYLHYRIIKPEL